MNFLNGDPISLEHKIDIKSASYIALFLFVAIVLGFALGTAIFKAVR